MKQRKDGRWEHKITIKGKRVSFYSSESTERKAEKDIQRQLIEYQTSSTGDCPFEDIAERWSNNHCQRIPYTTWKKCYRASYNVVIDEFKGEKIAGITAPVADRFLRQQISQGKSQKTISTIKTVLSMILDQAILEGLINYNPVKNLKLPSNLPKTPRRIPTDDEINIIKQSWEGFDLLPYFLLYSGLRISEALALTDKDIDRERKVIIVNKKIVHDDNVPLLIHQTKTAAGQREVILLDRLSEKLPEFKGILFDYNGGYMTKRKLQGDWYKWQSRLGITVTAHQLRHAYATLLYESGVDVKTAQALLGHSDIKMTMDVYAELRGRQLDTARDKLNRYDY